MLPVNSQSKNLRTANNKTSAGRAGGTGKARRLSFSKQLETQMSANNPPTLKEQLNQLHELLSKAGDELERSPTLGNLEVFRALLANLVGKVVKEGFEVSNVGPGWHPAERHQLVRRVDAEAEELLQLVMSEQKDRVAISRRLLNIKGLVIDLMS